MTHKYTLTAKPLTSLFLSKSVIRQCGGRGAKILFGIIISGNIYDTTHLCVVH
jgi:hypothetical protein